MFPNVDLLMREDIDVFLRKAEKFDSAARYFLSEGVYDLAAFHIEQTLQLYLKYILAKVIGYFPKTHSLTKLFRELSKIDEDFMRFYQENEIILKDIEDAYILSKYFPREYSESEVKALDRFKERFKRWIS